MAAPRTQTTRVMATALRIESKEGQDYLKDMSFCQDYALSNRRFMMEAFERVYAEVQASSSPATEGQGGSTEARREWLLEQLRA